MLFCGVQKTYFHPMAKILGEFEVTLDPKGRFMLPIGLKKQLAEGEGGSFVLNRGVEKCLTLYTMKQWEKIEAVILKLNDFNDVASKVKRQLLSGATILETDAAGRILIPKSMLAYAGITKDIVFSAQMNKMEIWDAETHRKETTIDQADFKSMVGSVLGSNFLNPFDGE